MVAGSSLCRAEEQQDKDLRKETVKEERSGCFRKNTHTA